MAETSKLIEPTSAVDSDCPICKEIMSDKDLCVTSCNHTFCLSCLLKHLNKSQLCPLCNGVIKEKEPNTDSEVEEEVQQEEAEEEDEEVQEQDAEAEEEEEESEYADDDSEDTVIELKTYDLHGRFSVNNNLKYGLMCFFVWFQFGVVFLSVTMFNLIQKI